MSKGIGDDITPVSLHQYAQKCVTTTRYDRAVHDVLLEPGRVAGLIHAC
jgi:hypothetical protein